RKHRAAKHDNRDREGHPGDGDENSSRRLAAEDVAPASRLPGWALARRRVLREHLVIEEVLNHQTRFPKRRRRASNSAKDPSKASRSKSGQSSLRKTNSE